MEKGYILLIENSPVGFDLLNLCFEGWDFNLPIVEANGGEEALEIVRSRQDPCRLLFTSEMMPKWMGHSLVQIAHSEGSVLLKILATLEAHSTYMSGTRIILKAAFENLPIENVILTSAFDASSLNFRLTQQATQEKFRIGFLQKPFSQKMFIKLVKDFGLNPTSKEHQVFH